MRREAEWDLGLGLFGRLWESKDRDGEGECMEEEEKMEGVKDPEHPWLRLGSWIRVM
jgi:hypothetical protein